MISVPGSGTHTLLVVQFGTSGSLEGDGLALFKLFQDRGLTIKYVPWRARIKLFTITV